MKRLRREEGVTIVEASFVLPILFMFVFGLVDLGMWTFNSNQATNAARDGARAAILSYEFADDPSADPHTPTDRDRIVAAVRDRLPDQTVDESDVAISCERGGAAIACKDAVVDEDHIRVEVEWAWDLVTPIATVVGVDSGKARGSATMAIVGTPLPSSGAAAPEPDDDTDDTDDTDDGDGDGDDTEDPPAACDVTALSTTPTSVSRDGNQLEEALWIEFTTNGSVACSDLRIELVGTKSSAEPLEYPCGCGDGLDNEFAFSYSGSNNIWQQGTGTASVLNGTTVLETTTFFVN